MKGVLRYSLIILFFIILCIIGFNLYSHYSNLKIAEKKFSESIRKSEELKSQYLDLGFTLNSVLKSKDLEEYQDYLLSFKKKNGYKGIDIYKLIENDKGKPFIYLIQSSKLEGSLTSDYPYRLWNKDNNTFKLGKSPDVRYSFLNFGYILDENSVIVYDNDLDGYVVNYPYKVIIDVDIPLSLYSEYKEYVSSDFWINDDYNYSSDVLFNSEGLIIGLIFFVDASSFN